MENLDFKDSLMLLFIYLKLTNQIDWCWFMVISPFWIWLIIIAIIEYFNCK